MRRFFILIPAVIIAACSSFGSGTASDPPVVPPDAEPDALPDAASGDAPTIDATKDGATCTTQTYAPFHDGNLNFEANHNDFGGEPICNISVSYCLVSFDVGADSKKRITSLVLELPRSRSSSLYGPGALGAAHMRPDWDDAATWFKRTLNPIDTWDMNGAEAVTDVASVAGIVDVKDKDDATITLDLLKLNPKWLASGVLAFRVKSAIAPFPFVIQRNLSMSALDLPKLRVTTCQ